MKQIVQMSKLWKLQQLEQELLKLKEDKIGSQIKEQLLSLQKSLLERKKKLQIEKDKISKLEAELVEHKKVIDVSEGHLEQNKKELYNGKNTNVRELEALYNKGEAEKEKFDKLQDEYLVLEEENENNMLQFKELYKHYTKGKTKFLNMKEQYKQHREETMILISSIQEKIEVVEHELDQNWLNLYKKQRQSFGVTAVALVNRNICTGCHLGLSYETLRGILDDENPRKCEHCDRILYVPREELQA